MVERISVIICAYTSARMNLLRQAIHDTQNQLTTGDELLVVVDHNVELAQKLKGLYPQLGVYENQERQGLSGARNTGIAQSKNNLLVFLDDDASPLTGWLDSLRGSFGEGPILGVAGGIVPNWENGRAPVWFPKTFGWVVGCDYEGLAGDKETVRNPIGANMAIRKDLLGTEIRFNTELGRVGTKPVGCEETELAIALRKAHPELNFVRNTHAQVKHFVPQQRAKQKYFLQRCWHEGKSKSRLVSEHSKSGLASEKTYALKTLPTAFFRSLGQLASKEPKKASQAAFIVLGLGATTLGFLTGKLSR